MRMRDRLEAVGRVANDRELRPLMENVAERAADIRVIVHDENPERVRRRAALWSGGGDPIEVKVDTAALLTAVCAPPRGATNRTWVPFPARCRFRRGRRAA